MVVWAAVGAAPHGSSAPPDGCACACLPPWARAQILCSRLKVLVTPQVNVLMRDDEGPFVREEYAPNILRGFWERQPQQRRLLQRLRYARGAALPCVMHPRMMRSQRCGMSQRLEGLSELHAWTRRQARMWLLQTWDVARGCRCAGQAPPPHCCSSTLVHVRLSCAPRMYTTAFVLACTPMHAARGTYCLLLSMQEQRAGHVLHRLPHRPGSLQRHVGAAAAGAAGHPAPDGTCGRGGGPQPPMDRRWGACRACRPGAERGLWQRTERGCNDSCTCGARRAFSF